MCSCVARAFSVADVTSLILVLNVFISLLLFPHSHDTTYPEDLLLLSVHKPANSLEHIAVAHNSLGFQFRSSKC